MLELHLEIDESTQYSPEQRLWRAVLQRAFEDVIYPGMERPLVIFKYKAHLWFMDKSDEFCAVCYMAGFDCTYVHETYQRMVEREQVYFTQNQLDYINWRKLYNQKRGIEL